MAGSRLAALVSILLLAACGGGQESDAAARADVFRQLAQAAVARDGDRMWALLSDRMKEQTSRDDFDSAVPHLRDDFLPVADGPVVLDADVAGDTAVVALGGGKSGPGAEAVILRREEDDWRVQLSEIDLNFGSGSRDFTVNARGLEPHSLETRAWIDGREVRVRRGKDTYAPTFYVVPAEMLSASEHTVVAYVRVGERSGAIAWTFEG